MASTRVLVTGGTGFLGSEIVKALVEANGFAITALDINPPSLGTSSYSGVTYVRCDILKLGELREVFKKAQPTVVVRNALVPNRFAVAVVRTLPTAHLSLKISDFSRWLSVAVFSS
ncbi:hypothetical protein SLS60_011850 [Paraconiothyrium brasiliense]|uniref:NAD-dependent epimerase/dehydratase domain-containing protein n=1 Tax=Paraconiothyrium brasiliense TaxID=300254 RepID=A0ABR3QHG7_9PLEO